MSCPELGKVFITVSSFAFQIAGAVILLIWSLHKPNKMVEAMAANNDGLHWLDMNGYTEISATKLQSTARTVYQNIFAFINLIIGYTCAIFSGNTTLEDLHIFALTILATILILLTEYLLIWLIAKMFFHTDRRIKAQ